MSKNNKYLLIKQLFLPHFMMEELVFSSLATLAFSMELTFEATP